MMDAVASLLGSQSVLVLLGAIVALDQVAVAQLQLAHPLVAGTLAGAIGGEPLAGALVGALMGLILAGHRPVGGVVPPDSGVASVIAAGSFARSIWAGSDVSAARLGSSLALAILLGLILADLGRHGEAWTRRRNLRFLQAAEAEGTPGAVSRAVGSALSLAALRGALTVAVALPLVTLWLNRAPVRGPGVVVVVALVAGIGLAAGERLLGTRRRRGVLLAAVSAAVAYVLGGLP